MKNAGSSTRTSTNKINRGGNATSGSSDTRFNYVEGSAVRKVQEESARREYTRLERTQQVSTVRRVKVKAVPMNIGYIAVMAAALIAVCVVLMSYIKMQSDITNHITNISKLESQLNEMKLANDETYTKIMSSVDLEEIKRIAVNELGMKYAEEGQVIQYTGEGNDYVRQYSDIPR